MKYSIEDYKKVRRLQCSNCGHNDKKVNLIQESDIMPYLKCPNCGNTNKPFLIIEGPKIEIHLETTQNSGDNVTLTIEVNDVGFSFDTDEFVVEMLIKKLKEELDSHMKMMKELSRMIQGSRVK